jgi:ATP-binding protein involved in chromosome partitioning
MAHQMKNLDEKRRKLDQAFQDIEIQDRLGFIRHKIVVMSGKGGVGKSSVAAYLAVTLAKRGYTVGLMDVDLHGPSTPHILGLEGTVRPCVQEGKMLPVRYRSNMEVISIEMLMTDKDAATIWRGPVKTGVIRQFIADIEWMDLDYMIVDSPPGTGDEPLTVAQTMSDAKAVIVTTPQDISLADVRKSINFCREVDMEILGLVENMSAFKCPHCGRTIELFRSRGGLLTSQNEHLRFLGSLPFDQKVVSTSDAGSVSILEDETSPFALAFQRVVDAIEDSLETNTRISKQQKRKSV